MKKFLVRFSPLLVNLMFGSLMAFIIGEVFLIVVMGLFYKEYLFGAALGYVFGYLISVARILHMYWGTIGTFYNEESWNMPYFSGKSYMVRNGLTMIVWVCIFYFAGQTCMLSSILGTILISKVAVFMQPITDKFFITKIFK